MCAHGGRGLRMLQPPRHARHVFERRAGAAILSFLSFLVGLGLVYRKERGGGCCHRPFQVHRLGKVTRQLPLAIDSFIPAALQSVFFFCTSVTLQNLIHRLCINAETQNHNFLSFIESSFLPWWLSVWWCHAPTAPQLRQV